MPPQTPPPTLTWFAVLPLPPVDLAPQGLWQHPDPADMAALAGLAARAADATPEAQIAAAMRYARARYARRPADEIGWAAARYETWLDQGCP